MDIRLTNTLTRKKEPFAPIDPQNVRLYLCGPTVYDRAHLGNARPVLVFDVLFRLLRHVYGDDHVTYVRNFTDVDDKINATAMQRKEAGAEGTLEELVQARSDETIAWYHADMDALGALRPTHEPRATAYIAQMVAMIERLIASDHAYEAEGHVLFAVDSYAEYGRLSGRSVDDMIAGARVEVAPYKRNPMDFVLWKPSGPELPGWDSPWGRGRPGWHIECSAMSHELLGESFDIHGGGNDLTFPHHENEIAQSCCAYPGSAFARVWLHNEMLQVEGKKMSKSLGNFFTVRDLLDQGIPGEVIRFVMLSTHYRKPMDWTAEKAKQAQKTLQWWRTMTEHQKLGRIEDKVIQSLAYDLNTPKAIKELEKLASVGAWSDLKASAAGLGPSPETSKWDWKDRSIGKAKDNWKRNLAKFEKIRAPEPISPKVFNSINESLEKMQEAAQSVAAFTQTAEFQKTLYSINKFRKVIDQIDFSEFERAAKVAEQWKELMDRNPRVLETVDNDVQVSLSIFADALKADIASLVDEQQMARTIRNYEEADRIRLKAKDRGFEIVNTRDGAKWRPMP